MNIGFFHYSNQEISINAINGIRDRPLFVETQQKVGMEKMSIDKNKNSRSTNLNYKIFSIKR